MPVHCSWGWRRDVGAQRPQTHDQLRVENLRGQVPDLSTLSWSWHLGIFNILFVLLPHLGFFFTSRQHQRGKKASLCHLGWISCGELRPKIAIDRTAKGRAESSSIITSFVFFYEKIEHILVFPTSYLKDNTSTTAGQMKEGRSWWTFAPSRLVELGRRIPLQSVASVTDSAKDW